MRFVPFFILFLSAAVIFLFPSVSWSSSQLEKAAAPIDW
jgi:hypothetical protein